MSGEFEALTIDDYAKQAARTDQRSGKSALGSSMLGLFGEAGSLLSEAKKKQRDAASYLGYADAVAEAFHAEEAAKRGMLREYTAWAVAVGEVDRWSRACSAASIAPSTAGLGYALMAPHIGSAASHASTAPSSSGGGGGGGVGGGGGGGGGGSW